MRKEESAHMGQKIRSETSPDRSSHKVNEQEAFCGRKMKGGPTDISHSIKSGMTVPGSGGKSSKGDY
jgi:hypothetical protein